MWSSGVSSSVSLPRRPILLLTLLASCPWLPSFPYSSVVLFLRFACITGLRSLAMRLHFSIAGGLSSSRNHIPTLVTPTITRTIAVTKGGTNMIRFHSFVPPKIITVTPIAGNSNTSFKHMNERTLMYAHVFLVGPNDTFRRGALTRLILLRRLLSVTMLRIILFCISTFMYSSAGCFLAFFVAPRS